MSSALGLMRLQQVDTRIDQVEDSLERIRLELANDAEVQAANTELAAADATRSEAELQRHEAEVQANSVRNKIQQAESSLYGGKVHNPKELQDLQAEVVSLKRHMTALEGTELSWMEKLEAAEGLSIRAREQLEAAMARAEARSKRLIEDLAGLRRTHEDLQAEREAASGAVAPKLLESYERLRKSRRGVAVAEVRDDACGACGTTLTAALQQSARHAPDLVNCPSCGRILYGG
jgi:predicted  nucleic acid-binding Zn-ribbon protein